MARALAAVAVTVAAALHLFALQGAGPRAAAARPVGRRAAGPSATASELALAPAAQRRVAAYDGSADADAAAMAGKWLPFLGGGGVGVHHHPSAFWAHTPVPWVGVGEGAHPALGGAGAVEGGEGEELVRERERSPYVDGGMTTRQEQLAMWASLLNPKGNRRPATGWLPVPGIGDAADGEKAKASDATATEGTGVNDPAAAGGVQVGQTKSGLYWGNNGN